MVFKCFRCCSTYSEGSLGDRTAFILSISEGGDDVLDVRNNLDDIDSGGIGVELADGANELGDIRSTFDGGDNLAVGGDGGNGNLDTAVIASGLEVGQEVLDGQKLSEDIFGVVVQILVNLEGILGDVTDLLDAVEVDGSFESRLLLGLAFGGNVLTRNEDSLDIDDQVGEVLVLEVRSEGLEGFNDLLAVNDATVEISEFDLGNV